MRTRENFPVGHPSQIAPSQAHLTWRFFRARLPKKKMHLVGMDTLLILLSLGPGYHHPRARISQLCIRFFPKTGCDRMERNRALFTVRCAPNSPVHPQTEGNQGLPNKEETTHLTLGAIKGPPRRMEHLPKHTKSTPKLRFNATTLLTHSREN
jgi:hypothetical protein